MLHDNDLVGIVVDDLPVLFFPTFFIT
jgi:hypothetical protein